MNITIRPLKKRDYNELAGLMTELGYPATIEEITARFEKLEHHPDYASLVAVVNEKVVGFSGLCRMHYFEMNGTYLRILAFIVSSTVRKQGIGSKLLAASENWAMKHGCTGIALNSGNRPERQAAHAFYRAHGYEVKSSGFAKKLI